jgi:hypothetical protein
VKPNNLSMHGGPLYQYKGGVCCFTGPIEYLQAGVQQYSMPGLAVWDQRLVL